MRRLTLTAVWVALVLFAVGAASPATQGRWVIRDLGTFGGPASEAVDINERGQIAGKADTKMKDGEGEPIAHAFLWQNSKLRDLGTLGGKSSYVTDLNDRGQVVGGARTKRRTDHAFLWQNGTMRDLGTLGGQWSEAHAINERGQVVGIAQTKTGKFHAFLWQNGKMRDLGTLGGPESEALGINEPGQVVGRADIKGKSAYHAFLWQEGKMRDLGTLGGSESRAVAINDRGQVVGSADTGDLTEYEYMGVNEAIYRAFLWENGRMLMVGPSGGGDLDSWAVAIDNSGQVIGGSFHRDDPAETSGFLWQTGMTRDLGALSGMVSTDPYDVNEHGLVVGETWVSGSSRAFIWQNGTMTGLPGLDGSGWGGARALSERGQVVGRSLSHAVLWTYKR